jgi:hypothetical protein
MTEASVDYLLICGMTLIILAIVAAVTSLKTALYAALFMVDARIGMLIEHVLHYRYFVESWPLLPHVISIASGLVLLWLQHEFIRSGEPASGHTIRSIVCVTLLYQFINTTDVLVVSALKKDYIQATLTTQIQESTASQPSFVIDPMAKCGEERCIRVSFLGKVSPEEQERLKLAVKGFDLVGRGLPEKITSDFSTQVLYHDGLIVGHIGSGAHLERSGSILQATAL